MSEHRPPEIGMYPAPLRLKTDEKQLLAMALAHLEVERPGWREMLHTFAARLDIDPALYQHFHALRVAQVARPDAANDSIMQLRQVIDQRNPMLWAMVQEIAWPR